MLCPHCHAGKSTMEIAGLQFHVFSDRWISCAATDQNRITISARRELLGQLPSAFQSISVRHFVRLHRRFYPGKSLEIGPASH